MVTGKISMVAIHWKSALTDTKTTPIIRSHQMNKFVTSWLRACNNVSHKFTISGRLGYDINDNKKLHAYLNLNFTDYSYH